MLPSSQKDKVSVVVPVYNSERFLEECLNSILSQNYEDLEVIAVDDGSTDSSLEILKGFSDKITVISQENSGLGHALCAGIKRTNGNWFKWFSPDDVMKQDTVESLVNAAKKFTDNAIVYSNWTMIDENGKKLRDFFESDYNELSRFDFNVRLLDGQLININTTLVPCSLLKKGCLPRNLKDSVATDYDFFLRAALHYEATFHLVKQPLIKYRIHGSQLSHKHVFDTLRYLSELKQEILNDLDSGKRHAYLQAWNQYQKKKKITKKITGLGLKIMGSMPDSISDSFLTFYLNKIRRHR